MKSSQDQIFLKKEGDRWYERNQSVLGAPKSIRQDWPLKLIKASGVRPKNVLEVGCSTGWRLAEIRKRYRSRCVGVDPSHAAIQEGRRAHPRIIFKRGLASALPLAAGKQFDLVLVNFVLHWISRDSLLRSIAEIDRVVADGGYLLVADFFPDRPVKTRYHHLPREKIFTYKMDYAGFLAASGLYKKVRGRIFDHSRPRSASSIPSSRRASCWLLQKSLSRYYRDSLYSPSQGRSRA